MTLEDFLDGLQTLLALDLQEVSASGAMSEHDLARWNSFRADPARWLVRADEETARALWLPWSGTRAGRIELLVTPRRNST